MDLNQARNMAYELIDKHCGRAWDFKFNNAKRQFGNCDYKKQIINLSSYLTELNDEIIVKNVILHEIAHALTKGEHHNNVWKETAIQIGCDGNRIYDETSVIIPPYKYNYECPNCKRKIFRRKISNSACGLCCKKYNNNKYTEKFKLKLIVGDKK